ncbi:MAG: hypothetical protein K8L99_03450, partial [Anaerolineae bacterium]|nr:hypothetical protein [Anaerolineae bacterium]
WAHFYLPNWLIALCFVLALWLVHRGLRNPQYLLVWVTAAGLVLGVAALARLNLAPMIALLGIAFFLLRDLRLTQRVLMFITLGLSSLAMLVLYTVLIHYPSTGTWTLNCQGGANLLVSAQAKGLDLVAANGPETQYYLQLLTLEPTRQISFTSESYPLWSIPGPWVTPEEYAAFMNQPSGAAATRVEQIYPGSLYYFLGPCETDRILYGVFKEGFQAQPLVWFSQVPVEVFNMLAQNPSFGTFYPVFLPRDYQVEYIGNNILGFQKAEGNYFDGQWVWRPGIWFYTNFFELWNAFKWLAPLALVWAFLSREWFYKVSAILLLASLVFLSFVGNPSPRLYAPLYPLTPLLIGGFLMWLTDLRVHWRPQKPILRRI